MTLMRENQTVVKMIKSQYVSKLFSMVQYLPTIRYIYPN